LLVDAVNKTVARLVVEARKTIALVASAMSMSFPFTSNYQTKLVAFDINGKVR